MNGNDFVYMMMDSCDMSRDSDAFDRLLCLVI